MSFYKDSAMVDTLWASRTLTNKRYELSNHLGNVLSTITDRKTYVDTIHVLNGQISIEGSDTTYLKDTVVQWDADVLLAQDYYPFGMPMPGRNMNSGDYRFGFNGMERNDNWQGAGNSYDFGARIYDASLGRWLALDPLASRYPLLSPYQFAANSVMILIDPDGRKIIISSKTKQGEDAENAKAYLEKFEEYQSEFFSKMDNLRYVPETGEFISDPENEKYKDAMDVVVELVIMDKDGVLKGDERRKRFDQSFRIQGIEKIDTQGEAFFNTEFAGWNRIKQENGEFKVLSKDLQFVTLNSLDDIENFEPYGTLIVLREVSKGKAHFRIELDDYFPGGIEEGAQVVSHEFGHLEGYIENQTNEAYFRFGPGRREMEETHGHADGQESGYQASDREAEFNESKKD